MEVLFVPKEVGLVFLSSRKSSLMDSIKCTLFPVYFVIVYGLFKRVQTILCAGSSPSAPSSFVLSVLVPKYGLAMVKIETLHSVQHDEPSALHVFQHDDVALGQITFRHTVKRFDKVFRLLNTSLFSRQLQQQYIRLAGAIDLSCFCSDLGSIYCIRFEYTRFQKFLLLWFLSTQSLQYFVVRETDV